MSRIDFEDSWQGRVILLRVMVRVRAIKSILQFLQYIGFEYFSSALAQVIYIVEREGNRDSKSIKKRKANPAEA